MTKPVIKIGNAQGFWGDRTDAAAEMLRTQPDLDYLTLDYLAEVSMSILARQRARDPSLGYACDFVDALELAVPHWRSSARQHRTRIITNAGGLNPRGCADACREILRKHNVGALRIAVVSGDDVLQEIRSTIARDDAQGYAHLELDRPINEIADRLTTANAYLGAKPIADALATSADLVITGRVADPSMAVAPCMHHFHWSENDYKRLAAATVAGHLIECGTQVTGGVSTDWLSVPDFTDIGFPIVEIDADASVVVTKPKGSGGCVNCQTVKEQLVYEIGDPGNYLSPDATVSFRHLTVDDLGNDRVRVTGAVGSPPPATYKVSATYRNGYRATGQLTVLGADSKIKAERCGQVVQERLRRADSQPAEWLVETIDGELTTNRTIGGTQATVLRMSAADPRRDVVERFTREIMPLVTGGPQGTTGYAAGRPRVQEVYGYWPCAIDRDLVLPHVELIEV
ncbi:MAG: DUF1446 domain-containing protein [Pirellulales bacterium]|nr:DUF1446 domain-containing protein [Pirellulales bacterium]